MIFTLKRVFKDIAFIILLAAVLIIPLIAFKTGLNISILPFAYVCNSDGDDIARLCEELNSSDFVRYGNRQELIEALEAAQIDCGIVFDDDYELKLVNGSLSNSIELITSSETVAVELCRIEAVAAISVVYSPYVTFNSLNKEIELSKVKETYYDMYDSGQLFSFDLLTERGSYSAGRSRSINLFRGALSILIFISVFIGICRPAYRHRQNIRSRLGGFKSFTAVMIPEVLIRSLALIAISLLCSLIMSIAGLGSISGDGIFPELCRTIIIYILICDAVGIILTLLLPDSVIIILTVFITILSLGLCPIFSDLSEIIPAAKTIRNFLLPYLMWIL